MRFDSARQALGYYLARRPGLSSPGAARPEVRKLSGHPAGNRAEDRLEPMLSLSLCFRALRPGERKALVRLAADPTLSLEEVARRHRTRPDLLRRRSREGLKRLTEELRGRGMLR